MSSIEEPGQSIVLRPTRCAICGCEDDSEELYPANLDADAFTAAVFSARRLPDRTHYRMVTCRRCGLVRSDPVVDARVMAELYRESTFDYGSELEGLRLTYGSALERIGALVPSKDGILDIGCGSGFVLELARGQGWHGARGVEPSSDAVAKASDSTRPLIVEDIMRAGLFEPESFDAVALFQVLDHMPDPGAVLEECRRVLRPGGVIMAFNHNVKALSAALLRERSPIVDVEHTYLYSPVTMRRLFSDVGFAVVSVNAVRNTYSVAYLLHLTPIPRSVKHRAVARIRGSAVGRVHLTLPLGNLCLIARRR
ncbi:MAG: class I SAM-dependent methyltransferase [Solirubrobacteraceae bacterium]